MFRDTIKTVVDGTEGGIAGLLMDFEGIAVDQYARDEAEIDIEHIGAELSVILKSILRAAEQLQSGGAREVAIQAEKLTTLIRVVNSDYFLAVAMSPDGNVGKGRFLLRLAVPKIQAELE